MDSKRFMTRVVVGAVAMYVVGYLVWQVLFAGYFEAHAGPGAPNMDMSASPIWWASILGTLCYATLVALALDWSGAADVGAAVKTGAIVCLLMWGMVDLTFYAFFGLMDVVGAFSDIALEGVRGAVAALAMSMVGGKGSDAA